MKPIEKIILTDKEADFLRRYCHGEYNPITATVEDQDIEIALIEKASRYEAENHLVDERIDFTPNCDLLKWYYWRYFRDKIAGPGTDLSADSDTVPASTSNVPKIIDRIRKGETVYMRDDFYDVAIRLDGDWDEYLKHKGRGEVKVPHGYKLVLEIELGGEFITKEEYDAY